MIPRDRVLWLGRPPEAGINAEFSVRGLRLHSVAAVPTKMGAMGDVAAVVYACDASDATLIGAALGATRAHALDEGARVEVQADDDAAFAALLTAAGEAAAAAHPHVRFRTAPPVHAAAEEVARHRRGPALFGMTEIAMARNARPLGKAETALFRRAFAGCTRADLSELGGGRSDARVFAAHVTVSGSRAGPRPQPMFAKIDRLDKVEREFWNYREFGDRYLPFGLRPNIHRLVRGAAFGVLVGDFVDKSESLWDRARRGAASTAIHSLFADTLAGWRDQASSAPPVTGSVALAMQLAGVCDPERILDAHVDASGCGLPATTLWGWLVGVSGQTYRSSPVHGDLHGENVRVVSDRSILIDLASVRDVGPLTTDVAALEVHMAFEPVPGDEAFGFVDPEWCAEVDRLYAPGAFAHPPGRGEPTSRLQWMASTVRDLRGIGISSQSCATEYETAVAVQLLRRCQWLNPSSADCLRRAHGYMIASRLAAHVAGGDLSCET